MIPRPLYFLERALKTKKDNEGSFRSIYKTLFNYVTNRASKNSEKIGIGISLLDASFITRVAELIPFAASSLS